LLLVLSQSVTAQGPSFKRHEVASWVIYCSPSVTVVRRN
jgi:hypothetical protein